MVRAALQKVGRSSGRQKPSDRHWCHGMQRCWGVFNAHVGLKTDLQYVRCGALVLCVYDEVCCGCRWYFVGRAHVPAFTARFVYVLQYFVGSLWFGGHKCPPYGDVCCGCRWYFVGRALVPAFTVCQGDS